MRWLPTETAHNFALWAFRTGFYRVGLLLDAAFYFAIYVAMGIMLVIVRGLIWVCVKIERLTA